MKKLLLIGLVMLTSACGIEQVNEGYRGIETNWGKVVGDPLTPGLYFYNPISSDIFELTVKEEKLEGETACFTKDTQTVNVKFVVTFFPQQDKIGELYKQFGKEWSDKIITPSVLGSLKDAIGGYIADDLVSQRETVKMSAQKELVEALASRNVTVTRLDLVNLDFDDTYERAVEAKVVAIQQAQEAKNTTVKIEEQAKQKIMSAKAEAESMRIRSAALSQNKSLVEYESVQKWDGKLPEIIMGGQSIPFIDLRGKGSK